MSNSYKELRNEAIENISTEKLYNKSIKFNNKDYVIVAAPVNTCFFTLVLLNKKAYNFNDEVEYAQNYQYKLNDFVSRLNRSNIDAIVIQISNPLLRDDRFDDFYICYGEDHPYLYHYTVNEGVWPVFVNDDGTVIS
ncbi:MAG: hypothetical protein IJW36_02020, partial [Clostridia bacterium]|nr:hypothetical protein [Clostridia bacterium]